MTAAFNSLAERIDAVEEAYEFMLAYAAQGRQEEGDHALSQVRRLLNRAADALDGIAETARAEAAASPAAAAFVDVFAEDARRSLLAFRLVLASRSISSQLVDNLNGSIHVRALLTDMFLLDEFLKNG